MAVPAVRAVTASADAVELVAPVEIPQAPVPLRSSTAAEVVTAVTAPLATVVTVARVAMPRTPHLLIPL